MPERIAVTLKSVHISEAAEGGINFVTLQDEEERLMQVYIGKPQAEALALGLQGFVPERPHTYEALLLCVAAAGAAVEEVSITDLRGGIYYAHVALSIGGQSTQVEMRPSDALNVAVRTHCPLFVSEPVLLSLLRTEEPSVNVPQNATVYLPQKTTELSAEEVSAEIARLYEADQLDRLAWSKEVMSADEIIPRDAARLARVKQLYHAGMLTTGRDYYHAAMVLQHSSMSEDHLLAHEFCVAAIMDSVEEAKWLAAASEDRFLMFIDRPQRFGTQYRTHNLTGQSTQYPVAPEVENSLRSVFNVPALLPPASEPNPEQT